MAPNGLMSVLNLLSANFFPIESEKQDPTVSMESFPSIGRGEGATSNSVRKFIQQM